jgi:hypothetical protein
MDYGQLQAVVVGETDSLILLEWHRQGLLSNQQLDEEPETLGWLPTNVSSGDPVGVQLQAVVVGETDSLILLGWHCQGLLFNQPLDEEPDTLGWLPTSFFRVLLCHSRLLLLVRQTASSSSDDIARASCSISLWMKSQRRWDDCPPVSEVQLNWRWTTTTSELKDFLPQQQSLYWHLLADFPAFF